MGRTFQYLISSSGVNNDSSRYEYVMLALPIHLTTLAGAEPLRLGDERVVLYYVLKK